MEVTFVDVRILHHKSSQKYSFLFFFYNLYRFISVSTVFTDKIAVNIAVFGVFCAVIDSFPPVTAERAFGRTGVAVVFCFLIQRFYHDSCCFYAQIIHIYNQKKAKPASSSSSLLFSLITRFRHMIRATTPSILFSFLALFG